MRFFKLTAAILLPLSIGLVAFNSTTTGKNPVPKPAPQSKISDTKALPAFTMVDASGNKVDLQSFKGKKIFLNIWATWCPPCRSEIPSIEKLYKKTDKEKAVFILLSVDGNFETALKYAQRQGMKAPLYYPAENLPDMLYTTGIPATFIFDENGNLVKQNVGAEDYSSASYVKMLNN